MSTCSLQGFAQVRDLKTTRFALVFVQKLWFCINKCMNDSLAIQATNTWIKQQGISMNAFADCEFVFLRAQSTATELLAKYSHMLSVKQTQTLTNYRKAFYSKSTRHQLTPKSAYQVLNIGTRFRRKFFQLDKSFKSKSKSTHKAQTNEDKQPR